jgi:FtsH-binding integral membrane protein
MSNFDRNYAAATRVGDRAAVDAGLRAHMIGVYNTMALGVAVTGVIAWLTYQMAGGDAISIAGRAITGLTPFGQFIFSPMALLVVFGGTMALGLFMMFRIGSMAASTAFTVFMVYAAALGLLLSTIFLQYTGASITRVFFISATSFGALSLYGYTTQRDLSAFASFLIMGFWGLFVAILLNIWFQSQMLSLIISVAGVLIFAGLTAWHTQAIKESYDPADDAPEGRRKIVLGAIALYGDFINLFVFLLQLLGDRR